MTSPNPLSITSGIFKCNKISARLIQMYTQQIRFEMPNWCKCAHSSDQSSNIFHPNLDLIWKELWKEIWKPCLFYDLYVSRTFRQDFNCLILHTCVWFLMAVIAKHIIYIILFMINWYFRRVCCSQSLQLIQIDWN